MTLCVFARGVDETNMSAPTGIAEDDEGVVGDCKSAAAITTNTRTVRKKQRSDVAYRFSECACGWLVLQVQRQEEELREEH